jgi:hypothetical protein
MIKPLSQLSNLFPMIAQEGNVQPGQGLTATETFTYFVAAPVILFVVIGGLAWFAHGSEKKEKVATTRNADDSDFITFIA